MLAENIFMNARLSYPRFVLGMMNPFSWAKAFLTGMHETPAGRIKASANVADIVYSYFMDGMMKLDYPNAWLDYKGRSLRFDVSLPFSVYVLFETFKRETYKLDVDGRTVVDVGGFIGDSAIYYHLNNAEKVVVYEPHPSHFAVLKRNLKANKISGRFVKAVNGGIGNGDLFMPESSNGGRTTAKSKGIRVRNYCLDDILDGMEDAVLKMDCEGCEFSSLQHSELEGVSDVIMEYHAYLGNVFALARMMKAKGFKMTRRTDIFGEMLGIGILHFQR